ncbi:MAG: hypothetical protein IK111_06735 [Lachnospiraceae bacterium]|nr:hypothetical protein [Lachnospiraceae bacterium]
MGDENLNNGFDDTAGLFVSTQKKKKAEEEAKRKAEEEQARLAAAQEEARRMELEVEERRRRAEEEKIALEQAEREIELSRENKANRAEAPTPPPKEKKVKEKKVTTDEASGKSKLPMYIGIGAAALVLIIIIAVVLGGKGGKSGKGGGSSADLTELELNAEYTPKEQGYDVKLLYPDSVYTEVTEESSGDEEVTVHFNTGSEKDVNTDVVITKYRYDNTDDIITKTGAYMCAASDMQQGFQKKIKKRVEELIPGVSTSDEVSTDISADDAGKYAYTCSFDAGENGKGSISAWIDVNGNEECCRVLVISKTASDDASGCKAMADKFTEANSADAIMVPGNNPPEKLEVDGMLEIDAVHLGMPVPKDRFVKYSSEDSDLYAVWSDIDGTVVIAQAYEQTEITVEDAFNMEEDVINYFKDKAQSGVNRFNSAVESRNFLDDSRPRENGLAYESNFRDVIGGVTFWERDYSDLWQDNRTGKLYSINIITLVPEKHRDIYTQIFDKSLDRLTDL